MIRIQNLNEIFSELIFHIQNGKISQPVSCSSNKSFYFKKQICQPFTWPPIKQMTLHITDLCIIHISLFWLILLFPDLEFFIVMKVMSQLCRTNQTIVMSVMPLCHQEIHCQYICSHILPIIVFSKYWCHQGST